MPKSVTAENDIKRLGSMKDCSVQLEAQLQIDNLHNLKLNIHAMLVCWTSDLTFYVAYCGNVAVSDKWY